MSKHTPGPWIQDDEYQTDIMTPGKHLMICQVTYIDPDKDGHFAGHVTEANARLIAAAPELLEALNRVLAWADPFALPNCDRNEADVKFARAAIAKAEGR